MLAADALSLAGFDYLVLPAPVMEAMAGTATLAGYNDSLQAAESSSPDGLLPKMVSAERAPHEAPPKVRRRTGQEVRFCTRCLVCCQKAGCYKSCNTPRCTQVLLTWSLQEVVEEVFEVHDLRGWCLLERARLGTLEESNPQKNLVFDVPQLLLPGDSR